MDTGSGWESLSENINDEDIRWVRVLPVNMSSVLKLTSRSFCIYDYFRRPKPCQSSACQHACLCSCYSLCLGGLWTPLS